MVVPSTDGLPSARVATRADSTATRGASAQSSAGASVGRSADRASGVIAVTTCPSRAADGRRASPRRRWAEGQHVAEHLVVRLEVDKVGHVAARAIAAASAVGELLRVSDWRRTRRAVNEAEHRRLTPCRSPATPRRSARSRDCGEPATRSGSATDCSAWSPACVTNGRRNGSVRCAEYSAPG